MAIGKIRIVFLSLFWLVVGCTTMDNGGAKKPAPSGLISTPVSYYSTAKAKYLATKYKENLDRIIEQIVRNPKTAPLQFANNIASVGGIGFFTHSATKTADERYLEVVLATPETFETKGDYSEKVQRLFSSYGFDLLRILSGDGELYQDGELTGYGLNLAWRNVVTDPAGNRVMMARAIVYLPKDKVRNYLRNEIKQNELLAGAVIFGEEEDRPLTLVSYRPQDTQPDVRPAIREDNLTAAAESKPSQAARSTNAQLWAETNEKVEYVKADGSGLEAVANNQAELTAQKPEAAIALEPVKNDRSTSSEVASLLDGDKSASSTTSLSSGPKERPQGSRTATEVKTETQASTPKRPDKKIDTTQAPANSGVKAPAIAMENEAATAVRPSVPPEATPMVRNEEPQEIRREPVEPYVVAKPAELSSLEKAKTPLAEIPAAAQIETQGETSKIINEPKETRAESVNVLPAKNTSVARATETKTAPLPQAITSNQSPREMKETTKASTQVAPTNKNEAVTSEKEGLKLAEKITSIPEAAKAQMESPKLKPEPNIAPATTTLQKASDVTDHESVRNAATKFSNEKLLTDNADKTAVPVARPKLVTENPALSEKKTAPAPSAQGEAATARSKEPPRETQIALSPRPDPAQNTAPRAIVREQKQDDRALEIETGTVKPSGILPNSQSQSPTRALARPEPVRDQQSAEQLALLRKPADVSVESKPATRTVKPLEGFVIQIAFNDKDKAQHWAESMERRGYAVSVTETGAEGALRVRLGNFSVRDDAERQLRSFKQEGMNGIIINLPQSFQPARSSVP
ncbi:MAG TPA: SPOR domain-containing protein [Candidatus Binatia bacterium]